jgi:uncharacterized protein (DUF2336 family)
MAKIAALIPELEDVKHHSREKRAETLRRLTKLFVEESSRLNEIHVSLFDDVLGRLVADAEPEARCELSSRLASISNAPLELARRLARDEIAVAEPLLRNSPRLDEFDLISIAQTKGQAHLLAIARRASLREPVTDVLVERGDAAVVQTLADNRSARLSAHGFAMLAKRGVPDGVRAQKIGQCPNPPPDLFRLPEDNGSKLHCPVQAPSRAGCVKGSRQRGRDPVPRQGRPTR